MRTSSLDILESAHLLPVQAKAILQVMEAEIADSHSPLATRADLQALRTDFEAMERRLAHRFNTLLVALTGIFTGIVSLFAGFIYFAFAHIGVR